MVTPVVNSRIHSSRVLAPVERPWDTAHMTQGVGMGGGGGGGELKMADEVGTVLQSTCQAMGCCSARKACNSHLKLMPTGLDNDADVVGRGKH